MLKVMLVDDMDIVRLELKRMPVWGEKSGFTVTEEARNGEEALAKLKNIDIDLIITDIKMPKIDGMELLSKIIEDNICPCVVLLSDFSEFSYARQGIILGAFDFLAKPANEEELSKLLQRASVYINNKRQESERVRKLEEIFEEKTEQYFESEDIEKIVELVQSRDSQAPDAIEHIIERIAANQDFDMMKVEGALKKAVPQVVNGITNDNCWFEKFIDVSEFNNISVYRFKDFKDILLYIMDNVRGIIRILNTYQLGYQEKGIVWIVCNYVLQNIDSSLSLQIVSEKLYMNRTYISEVFKQKTGTAFIEYLTMIKMERAKLLVATTDMKSYEIAEQLGFRDVEYFGKLFKKHTGKSITEFRLKN